MLKEFIAWDRKKKCFINSFDVAVNGDGEVYGYGTSESADGYIDEVFHIELLEYCGKKDRNGTKLYRGDIVKAELDECDDDTPPAYIELPEKTIIGVVVIRPSEGAKLLVKKIIPKDAPGIAIGRTM